jgi:hypothetical protein
LSFRPTPVPLPSRSPLARRLGGGPVLPIAAALTIAAALAGCGGGGAESPATAAATAPPIASTVPTAAATPAPDAAATLPADAEIADLLYTDRRRVPAGFHVDSTRSDAVYATLAHLRNTDLDAAATPPHELCATEFGTALQWSETVAAAQPVYGDLVGNDVTARYYEFTRRLRTTPARTAVARVYRCEYLDRAGVDLRAASGPAGRLGPAARTPAELQSLGEYLWAFTDDNNAGRVVLRSTAGGDAVDVVHSIVLARLVRAGTPTDCDRVELWRLELRATQASGTLTRSATLHRTFGARRVGGVAQTCG